MKKLIAIFAASATFALAASPGLPDGHTSWSADNGNGTYTNPLFYDEFSDPDILRVGEDYYLAGTTMHTVPGLVILHSKDLVNWENVSYCFDRFDFDDDAFSLKNGKEIYGQGIWAPCIRYNDGKFYLYSNVNGKGLQCFVSDKIEGPWKHINMQGKIYDLSVLFDDDGKVYAIHGYGEVKCTELKPDMSGPIEETERVIIPEGNAVGEGHHMYKIDGKYYLISTDYMPNGRTLCSRADNIWGPYETRVITADETFGYHTPPMTQIRGRIMPDDHPVSVSMPNKDLTAATNAHQGGIVSTPDGQWWALLMQDFHSIGRTTTLAPITWVDGWPMFGLEGNLGRAPRTWTKPSTAARDSEPVHAPYQRSEDFNGKTLGRVWQWNHNPDDKMWSLKNGRLRLNSMPADQLMWARNTLTQRAIGPESIVTVEMDASGMKDGDVAGLGNINVPCSWIGLVKDGRNLTLRRFEQLHNDTIDVPVTLDKGKIWLRLVGDYDNDKARYWYSTDGSRFQPLGDDMTLSYQLITFQGSRPSLFAFNKKGNNGGYAEFDNFTVEEPKADRTGYIPFGKTFRIINLATGLPMHATPHGLMHDTGEGVHNQQTRFKVVDRGNGKVLLQSGDGRYVFVAGMGLPGDVRLTDDIAKAEEFMWQDYLDKEFMLMSTRTHTYVGKSPTTGSSYSMDYKGSDPARRNGAVFRWEDENISGAEDNGAYIVRDLDVKTRDGKVIKGQAFIPEGKKDKYPVAIMAHGFNGTFREPLPFAHSLAKRGVAAYIFDFIDGSVWSRSGNNTLNMNVPYEVEQIEDIAGAAKGWKWADTDNMALLGCSQGGLVASLASARHPELFKSLVLVYPALTIPDTAPMLLKQFDEAGDAPIEVMGCPLSRKYYESINGINAYDSIPNYKGETFIIYGDKDFVFAGAEQAAETYVKARKQIVPGGDHGFSNPECHEQATKGITNFLAHALMPRPQRGQWKFDANDPDVHDPVMAQENGKYYMFTTGMGVGMLSSPDMKTWKMEKGVLDPAPEWAKTPVPAYRGHTWAPDVIKVGDKWYLYYSCSTFGKNISAIGVATNKTLNPESPDYKWEDLGMVIQSKPGENDWNAIDPNVVIDEKENPWMVYGSFWDGIQLVPLKKDMKTLAGTPKTVARRHRPCSIAHNQENANDNAIEAPFIVKKDGWYYLFVSYDYCCRGLNSDYKTAVGRSRSVDGPYLDKSGRDMLHGAGEVIAQGDGRYSGVGHCSVYEMDGKWHFIAHGYDKEKNGASKLVHRNVEWTDGWPELNQEFINEESGMI